MPRSGYTEQPRASALGNARREIRPERAAEACLEALQCVVPPERPKSGATFRAPLTNHLTPGLKPWAVLCSRFAAKSDRALRDGALLRF